MKISNFLAVPFLTILAVSCEPKIDDTPPVVYNGFKTGTARYTVDSLTIDYREPQAKMTLHSATSGGATVEIRSKNRRWPLSDGTYYYIFNDQWTQDSNTVSACFIPSDGSPTAFCVDERPQTGQTPALELRVEGGKYGVYMGSRPNRFDSVTSQLEIFYKEP